MAGEALLHYQDCCGTDEQIVAQIRFRVDQGGDHPVEGDDPGAGIRGDVNVEEPAPIGTDTRMGESPAVAPHRLT